MFPGTTASLHDSRHVPEDSLSEGLRGASAHGWQWAYLCLLAHADTGEVCDAGVTRRERHHFWQLSKEDALVLRTE